MAALDYRLSGTTPTSPPSQIQTKILEKITPVPSFLSRYTPSYRFCSAFIIMGNERNLYQGLPTILSANGTGKSTLLNFITGVLQPVEGTISRHSALKLAKYSQHSSDQLPYDKSPIQYFQSLFAEKYPQKDVQAWRAQLGRFGLSGAHQTSVIRQLSDGLRNRVVFAQLAMDHPHILLLGPFSFSFRFVSSRFRIPFSGPQIPKYTRVPELAWGVNVNASVGVGLCVVSSSLSLSLSLRKLVSVLVLVLLLAVLIVWCGVMGTYGYDMVDDVSVGCQWSALVVVGTWSLSRHSLHLGAAIASGSFITVVVDVGVGGRWPLAFTGAAAIEKAKLFSKTAPKGKA
ncbi:hypothetical protein D9758_016296 [Tetrapyrgos nigripes]|uniref:ABC transporter domain-containing protein n=1 Tax=Tetrapyrgos nigripes TaxID=182062 RepID=A0A8H5CA70_9AGAR|nr:hypothetical protein D9758_016296 [Tetrapyrgos nigripes]